MSTKKLMSENQNQNLTILESAAKDVLEKLGYQASINIFSNEKDPTLKIVSVNSNEDLSVLIGKNGQNIKALEQIIKALYFKRAFTSLEQTVSFTVDVNDYRKFRAKQIIEKALEVANRVATSKKAEALSPMSSYERRLIHVELASYPDLETESVGEEPERRVVIRPLVI